MYTARWVFFIYFIHHYSVGDWTQDCYDVRTDSWPLHHLIAFQRPGQNKKSIKYSSP